MATLYSAAIKGGNAAPDRADGTVKVRNAKYTCDTAIETPAADDIIQMIEMPAGAVVLDIIVKWDALVATGTFDVGDGDLVDRFFDGLDSDAVAAADRWKSLSNGDGDAASWLGFHEYTEKDTIDIKLLTAGMADEDEIEITVVYYIKDGFAGEA